MEAIVIPAENAPDPHRWRRYAAMVAPAVFFFLVAYWRAAGDTVDDAYITFRCVANFVAGDGLTFNPGTRVEAFSNALLAFVLVPFEIVGFPLPLAARTIGLAGFGVAVGASFALARRAGAGEVLALAAPASLLACFPFVYYSVTGLETGLFAGLIAAATLRLVAVGELDRVGAALWLAVAACRPEGPAYLVVPALGAWVGPHRRRSIRWLLAVIGAIALGYLARYAYYGCWFPNPFYAKPPGGADLDTGNSAVVGAIEYLRQFVRRLGTLLPLLALFALRRDVAVLLPAAAMAVGLAFGLYAGGDWFPGARYFLPVAPVVVALGAAGAERLLALARGKLAAEHAYLVLLLAIGVDSAVTAWDFRENARRYPYHVMNGEDCRRAAEWIAENAPADERIATWRVGALGYYGRRHVVDLLGLASHDIALAIRQSPGYHPVTSRYGEKVPAMMAAILAERPTALLLVGNVHAPAAPAMTLWGKEWRLVQSFPQGSDQAWLYYREGKGP